MGFYAEIFFIQDIMFQNAKSGIHSWMDFHRILDFRSQYQQARHFQQVKPFTKFEKCLDFIVDSEGCGKMP